MKKIIQLFISKIKFIIIIYAVIHLIILLNLEPEYSSDALYYHNLAQECLINNEFYPTSIHLYEDYIVAPLYINILVVLLSIYNSPFIISLFNFIILLLQLLILYKFSKKIFSRITALLTILLYFFYMNTTGFLLQNYTELLFLLFLSASIYFFILNTKINLLLSGIILGCALAIRPAAWALVLAIVIIQFFKIIKFKKLIPSYFYMYGCILIFILCFGSFTYLHFGRFEFTSTTGSVNVLLGANDNATGGFNSTVFEKGKAGYIEHPDSLTYLQKGKFYQDNAFDWIYEHPIKWISLFPLKLFHTFGWDDITISSLLGYGDTNFAREVRILFTQKDFNQSLKSGNTLDKILYFSILFLHHLFYYLILITILLGTIKLFKLKQNNDGTNLILLFSIISIFMIMLTVGTPRYKYPIFILLLPFAANYIHMKFRVGKQTIE